MATHKRNEHSLSGERALREKYGGKLPKAINRAIRAEIPGGNEALDKLTQLAGAARQSHWKDRAGKNTAEADAYFKHKRDVVDRMDAQVRKTWSIPPDAGDPKRASAPRTKPRPQRAGKGAPSRGKPARGRRKT